MTKIFCFQRLRVWQWALLCCFLVSSAGCEWLLGDEGHFRERSMDYQKAKDANALIYPEGVAMKRVAELYPIPDVRQTKGFIPESEEDIPRPQSILSVDEDLGIEMRSDGNTHWLVVDKQFESLWASMNDYLLASGMIVEVSDKQRKLIETGWLKPRVLEEKGTWDSIMAFFGNDDIENTREKFLIVMTQVGVEQRYKVNIRHLTRVRVDGELPPVEPSAWEADTENSDLLDVLYAEVADYVANDRARKALTSAMSQNLKAMPKYLMTRDGNDFPVLMMQMDINRAWIEVGAAIKKAKLVQNDLNLSLGIYYISLQLEGDDEPSIFEVKLISAENGVQVAVQIDDDTVAPVEVSDELLNAISGQLG